MIANENFFSVMKTLLMALGNQDPCQDLYKYANGLKKSPTLTNVEGEIQEQTLIVQSASEVLNNDWPQFDSEIHLKCQKEGFLDDENPLKSKISCKILVLFAEDGVIGAQTAVDISKTIEIEVISSQSKNLKIGGTHFKTISDLQDCDLELFRLNEATLWYEVCNSRAETKL